MKKNNSVFIVIVLYGKEPEDCSPLQFLLTNGHCFFSDYELLIYNNFNQINILPQNNYQVINASENNFLSEAYNYALEQAVKTQKKWLLLLDQDTELTIDYLQELIKIFDTDIPENLGAIVPQVISKKSFISPNTYFPLTGPHFFKKAIKKAGIYNNCFSAINSGTILDVETINETGGFSSKYPLDGLDFWYFFQLYRKKKYIYVMNAVLEHNLSVFNYQTIDVLRYQSILDSELRFCSELSWLATFFWKLKIPLRAIKRLCSKNRKYTLLTLLYLFK